MYVHTRSAVRDHIKATVTCCNLWGTTYVP